MSDSIALVQKKFLLVIINTSKILVKEKLNMKSNLRNDIDLIKLANKQLIWICQREVFLEDIHIWFCLYSWQKKSEYRHILHSSTQYRDMTQHEDDSIALLVVVMGLHIHSIFLIIVIMDRKVYKIFLFKKNN